MGVLLYASKRIAISMLLLVVASFVVYAFVRTTVDPTSRLHSKDKNAKIELKKELHLNDHIWVQYGRWASNALHGDLGRSDVSHEKVTTIFVRTLPRTMELIVWGLILATLLGISSGIISAIKQNTIIDYTVSTAASFGIALSVVFFGYILIEFFTQTFPHWIGMSGPVFYINGNAAGHFGQGGDGAWTWHSITEYSRHLALPAIALSVQLIAEWSRYQRSFMIESMQSDFMRTAHAKGMSKNRAYFHHGLRNAQLPMVSIIALDIAGLIGGLVVTERIFGINGMGLLFINSLTNGDATVLVSWAMLTAFAVIIFNLLADLIMPLVDPRIRTQ